MYRGIAFALEKSGLDLDAFLAEPRLSFSFQEITHVILDGEDISDRIRTPQVALTASSLSQNARVRAFLTDMQRRAGKDGGIVAEGRDTGTVVFPQADVKIYLDADIAERAKRRYLEHSLVESGDDFERVKAEMEKRDRQDSDRSIAPLVKPKGSFYVDTTRKTIAEVVSLLETHVRRKEG
jgi:cytidylate kinase